MYRTEEDMTEYATEVIAEGMDYLYDRHSHDYQYLLGELDGILKEASKRIKEEWEERDGNESIHSLDDDIKKKKKEIIRISLLAEQILKTLNVSDIKEIPAKLEDYTKNLESNTNYLDFETFNKKRNVLEVLSDILMIR
jgi:uncharacterized protein YecA (UPF0149 family)